MIFEKRWPKVSATPIVADGTADGVLQISDTRSLHVKQRVIIKSNTQPTKILQVNRVTSITTFEVGLPDQTKDIFYRENVSNYTVADGATILAEEQPRPKIGMEDYGRAVFQEEPANAIRTLNVDELGNAWNENNPSPTLLEFIRNGSPQKVLEDTVTPANNRPLPVKLTGVQGDVIIEAENLNLEVQSEGEYDPVDNPKPDSIGLVSHERGATQDRTKQLRRITAIRGDVDTDTVSQDISLHDQFGNGYTDTNPLPTKGSYEKFFTLIAASKWMELATYDEIVPSLPAPNQLVLSYYEDSALLGTVLVMNYLSPTTWSLKLTRYIDDDDGTPLLDDDDSFLLLD